MIRQDKLGLDVVFVQAKRWEGVVHQPVIHGFAGAMDGHQANRGVVMTTSTFSKGAREFAQRNPGGKKIVLVDGDRLAKLMVDHDLGVISTKTYVIKEVSNDFFDEGEG